MMMSISRRNFLKGIGVGAVALGVPASLYGSAVLAQAATPGVSAFSRFNVGEYEVTVIQDGLFQLDTAIFGANAEEGAVDALLAENNLPTGMINATLNITLVNTGDQLVLIDTGLSAAAAPVGGRLIPTLELLGVTAADINAVVLSHFHQDHVNGVSDGSAATFPNATYYFPQVEWDFLQNAPSDLEQANSAKALLQPISDGDQLQFYAADAEVVPGIQAIAAPGHTPGHSALLIASGGSQLLNIVDTAIQSVASVQRPDWYVAFDADGALASETRIALLGRAADEGLQILGYHFPFPGVGYIARDGESFQYTATI
jgi:glyoxylase-like metal-dependent hydrolase (beta-lactamase superfamily II)